LSALFEQAIHFIFQIGGIDLDRIEMKLEGRFDQVGSSVLGQAFGKGRFLGMGIRYDGSRANLTSRTGFSHGTHLKKRIIFTRVPCREISVTYSKSFVQGFFEI